MKGSLLKNIVFTVSAVIIAILAILGRYAWSIR